MLSLMILIMRKNKNGNHGMIIQPKQVILEQSMIWKFFNLKKEKNDYLFFKYSPSNSTTIICNFQQFIINKIK